MIFILGRARSSGIAGMWVREAGIAPGTRVFGFSHQNHTARFILGWKHQEQGWEGSHRAGLGRQLTQGIT